MRDWNFETPLSLRLQICQWSRPTDSPSRDTLSMRQGIVTSFFCRNAAGLEFSRPRILLLRLPSRAVGAGNCAHVWEFRDDTLSRLYARRSAA